MSILSDLTDGFDDWGLNIFKAHSYKNVVFWREFDAPRRDPFCRTNSKVWQAFATRNVSAYHSRWRNVHTWSQLAMACIHLVQNVAYHLLNAEWHSQIELLSTIYWTSHSIETSKKLSPRQSMQQMYLQRHPPTAWETWTDKLAHP